MSKLSAKHGRTSKPGDMRYYKFGSAEASEMGKRARANRVRNQIYMIEGKSVTIFDIAERIGTSTAVAYARMKKARSNPSAITWKSLMRGATA